MSEVLTYRGNQMNDETRKGRLSRRPVGSPELVAERKWYTFLGQFYPESIYNPIVHRDMSLP